MNPPEWIPFSPWPPGKFLHAEHGDYDWGEEMQQRLVANFAAYGQQLPFRDKHFSPTKWGWVQEITFRDGRPMARIQWTPPGLKAWENQQVKYVSAEIVPRLTTPEKQEIGPVLVGIAAADNPALKERHIPALHEEFPHAPVAFSEAWVGPSMHVFGELGDFINRRRQELEMTWQDISDAMPASGRRDVSTLQAIAAGDIMRPPDIVLRALAAALEVSFETLRRLAPAVQNNSEKEDSTMPESAATATPEAVQNDAARELADLRAQMERLQQEKDRLESEKTQQAQTFEERLRATERQLEVQVFCEKIAAPREDGRQLAPASVQGWSEFLTQHPHIDAVKVFELLQKTDFIPTARKSAPGEHPTYENAKQAFEEKLAAAGFDFDKLDADAKLIEEAWEEESQDLGWR